MRLKASAQLSLETTSPTPEIPRQGATYHVKFSALYGRAIAIIYLSSARLPAESSVSHFAVSRSALSASRFFFWWPSFTAIQDW
jgi:hypothetical protein